MGAKPSPQFNKDKVALSLDTLWSVFTRSGAPELAKAVEQLRKRANKHFDSQTV